MTPYRPLFDDIDQQSAKAYVEGKFAVGAFDPVLGGTEPRDDVAIASITSARDYMRQSASTTSAGDKVFRVYPCLVNSIQPNAFAAQAETALVCGVNVGLHAMVFQMACFIMAQQNMFTEIGDPKGEASPRFDDDQLPAFWLIDQTVAGQDVADMDFAGRLVPRDSERYQFAIYLTILMMRFVWFHELFHCLNGHVDYLAQFNRDIRLNEVADANYIGLIETQSASLPLPVHRFLRAIELDADRSALYGAYRTQLDDKENIIGIAKFDRAFRCRLALFASLFMTFLFDQINNRFGNDKQSTHPGSFTRLQDMMRTIAIHLADMDENISEYFTCLTDDFAQLQTVLPSLPALHAMPNNQLLDQIENDLVVARPSFQDLGYR